MSDEYQKLKDILRSNIKAVKDVTDNLFYVKDKLDATKRPLPTCWLALKSWKLPIHPQVSWMV